MPSACCVSAPLSRRSSPNGGQRSSRSVTAVWRVPTQVYSRLQVVQGRARLIWNGGAVRKSAEKKGRKRWERSVILFDHPQLSPALALACSQGFPFLLPCFEAHPSFHCLNPSLTLEMLLPFLASPKLGRTGCDLSPSNLLHLLLALEARKMEGLATPSPPQLQWQSELPDVAGPGPNSPSVEGGVGLLFQTPKSQIWLSGPPGESVNHQLSFKPVPLKL